MTSVTIGGAKMPVKIFLFWVLSASICATSASSAFHIRVNQLGFAPSDVKTAIVFSRHSLPADFRVLNAVTGSEGVQQGNSYGAPYRYAETTWADDMEWGAAELFRATKDARYLRDAKRYALLAGTESWMGKDEAGHYQYYPFMNIGHFRLYNLVDARTK